VIGPFFNRGLMLLDFDEHLYHRRIMQEAFTRTRLAGYVEHIDRVATAVVADWPINDARFLFHPAIKKLTLDVASMVFMGHQPGTDDELVTKVNHAFTTTTRTGGAFIRYPVLPFKWWRGLRARTVLEDYFTERVKDRRNAEGTDMLTVLCQTEDDDGNSFSDEDIVNHMIFLMMAAHDTSTSTTTTKTMAYNLAANPDWQERCRDESARLGDGPLDIESLEKLETLDLVMNESLRMVTPLPFNMRQTVRDTDLLGYPRAGRYQRLDLAGDEPPAARAVDRAGQVRPGSVRRTAGRAQEAPLRLRRPIRWRRAQVHRIGVRAAGGQDRRSPAAAPVPARAGPARLPAPLGLRRDADADGRHADRAASAGLRL
jgi:cytochrome P450